MMPNSLKYIVFLALAAAGHAIAPKKWRNGLLLAVSWLFYLLSMPEYLPLLIAVTALTWLAGRQMERRPLHKRAILTVMLLGCFGLLFVYKYLAFALSLLGKLPGVGTLELPRLVQPLGISFYLFCVTGYLIDVYRGTAAEKSFVDYSLMVSFFPAVLSGPIARSKQLLPQLKERAIGWMDVKRGITRFLVGLAKKMLLADALSAVVAVVYADVTAFTGTQVLFASVCYAMQIYCDFSSYSDMAVGAGLLFGIRLAENFDTPYFAQSIPELWRRWHMSLSNWFRDYLYFPLGGSRKGRFRTNLNLLIVFAVSGLWHGAGTQFLVWGLIHGIYQVVGRLVKPLTKPIREKLDASHLRLIAKWLRIGWVFFLTNIAWVFFRAESVCHALAIFRRIATFGGIGSPEAFGMVPLQFALLGLCLGMLLIWDLTYKKYDLVERLAQCVWIRYAVWTVLLLMVLCFGAYGTGYNAAEFVYFQF
jgi:D-alanyl-lipoteichoic acid acyltransferase DltB (MBOAT superfamily)